MRIVSNLDDNYSYKNNVLLWSGLLSANLVSDPLTQLCVRAAIVYLTILNRIYIVHRIYNTTTILFLYLERKFYR